MMPRRTLLARWIPNVAAAVCALALAALPLRLASAGPDPASRFLSGGSASEQWDVVAELGTGHRVFARFLVTNVGPGSQTAVAVGHVVTPAGDAIQFHSARRRGSWKLQHEGRLLDVGASHLDLRAGAQALDIHKPDVNVRIDFELVAGESAPPGVLPRDYFADRLGVDLSARARVQLAGMAGPLETTARVAVTHTGSTVSESDVSLRRIDAFFFGETESVQVSQFTPPVGPSTGWFEVTRGQEILASGAAQVTGSGTLPGVRSGGYRVPKSLEVKSNSLVGEISLGTSILEHDPLGDLPQPFRWLVSMSMRPHRVWAESVIDVTLPASPKETSLHFSGSAVTVVTFLNPLEKP